MPPIRHRGKGRTVCVGIDLGTSSSCCSYIDPVTSQLVVLASQDGTNKSTIPSVVHYSPTNINDILVGEQALQRAASAPKTTIFSAKRLIGLNASNLENKRVLKDLSYGPFDLGITSNGDIGFQIGGEGENSTVITPTNVATQIILYFMNQIHMQTGYIIDEVVLTVPAYFTPDQRLETVKAAQNAGVTVLRLIPEPTAAAFAYVHAAKTSLNINTANRLKDSEPDYILVYDFGGGTLDCSLVRQSYNTNDDSAESNLEVLATSGDPLLGGADLDNDLIKWCVQQLSKHFQADPSVFLDDPNKTRRLRQICKSAKERLSSSVSVELDLDDFYKREPFTLKLTRPAFQTICKDTLRRALNPIKQVLQDAGVDKSKVKDVVLVGGSSRLPIIQEQLKKNFNLTDTSQLSRIVNPDECVSKGAALFAATLTSHQEQKNDSMLANCVNSFPLTLYTHYGTTKSIVPLIKLNTPLPAQGSFDIELDRAVLRNLDPPTLRAAIFQVPVPTANTVEEQFQLMKQRMFKRWSIPLDGAGSVGFGDVRPYIVTIHYQIDANGIMDIFFQDQDTNTIIDVSLNQNTTNTAVKQQLDTQQKTDVLERYQHVQQQEQARLPVPPPPPAAALRQGAPTPQQQDQKIVLPHIPQKQPPQQPPPQQPPPTVTEVNVEHQQPPSFVPVAHVEPQQQPSIPLPVTPESTEQPQQQQQQSPPPRPTGPPPIPAHVNQKLIAQLKDLVQVRDDMILQLQQQIFQFKHQLEQQNVDLANKAHELDTYKWHAENEISELRGQVYTLTDKINHDNTPAAAPEPTVNVEQQVEAATAELNDRLVTMEEQYASLYAHYDGLHIENEQNKVNLEQKSLELRDLSSKYEHVTILADQYKSTQVKLENRIDELEAELTTKEEKITELETALHEAQTTTNVSAQASTEKTEPSHVAVGPPPIPTAALRQTAPVFTSDEQNDMILTSIPPLPPIAPTIFTAPTSNRLPPPPPRMTVRSANAPTPLNVSPLNVSPLSTHPSGQLPTKPTSLPPLPTKAPSTTIVPESQPTIEPTITPTQPVQPTQPTPPPAAPVNRSFLADIANRPQLNKVEPSSTPPTAPAGQAGKSFLADIMNRPQLNKVEKQADGTPVAAPVSADRAQSSGPPRVSLLSQLQQGQKVLKAVDPATQQQPKPTNTLFDGEIMDKIAKFRSQVAYDEEEEDEGDDDW